LYGLSKHILIIQSVAKIRLDENSSNLIRFILNLGYVFQKYSGKPVNKPNIGIVNEW